MDDLPAGGGGGYKIDWNAIDENTNPIEIKSTVSTFAPNLRVKAKQLDRSENATISNSLSSNLTKMEEKKKIETSMQENFEKLKRLSKPHTNYEDADPNQTLPDFNADAQINATSKLVNPSQAKVMNKNKSDSDSDVDTSPPVTTTAVKSTKSDSHTPTMRNPTPSKESQPSVEGAPKDNNFSQKTTSIVPNPTVQIKNLSPEAQLEILKLRKENENYKSSVSDMKRCIVEFERTLQQIMDEKQRAQVLTDATISELSVERDQAMQDLSTVEKAFGDLHRRFEKSKAIIDSFKANEDTLKQCIEKSKQKLTLQEEKYQTLKEKAEEKLKASHDEIESLKRSKEAELLKLQAALKRSEIQINSIDSQLQQKISENKELTKICDELISKCGT